MAWTWQFEPVVDVSGLGSAPDAPPASFAQRADAETWLGEHWRALATRGARSARLFDDEREVPPVIDLTTPEGAPVPVS
jgi:hypothetical protein